MGSADGAFQLVSDVRRVGSPGWNALYLFLHCRTADGLAKPRAMARAVLRIGRIRRRHDVFIPYLQHEYLPAGWIDSSLGLSSRAIRCRTLISLISRRKH